MTYRTVCCAPGIVSVDFLSMWKKEGVREEEVAETYVFAEHDHQTGMATHPITGKRIVIEDYL